MCVDAEPRYPLMSTQKPLSTQSYSNLSLPALRAWPATPTWIFIEALALLCITAVRHKWPLSSSGQRPGRAPYGLIINPARWTPFTGSCYGCRATSSDNENILHKYLCKNLFLVDMHVLFYIYTNISCLQAHQAYLTGFVVAGWPRLWLGCLH